MKVEFVGGRTYRTYEDIYPLLALTDRMRRLCLSEEVLETVENIIERHAAIMRARSYRRGDLIRRLPGIPHAVAVELAVAVWDAPLTDWDRLLNSYPYMVELMKSVRIA